MRTERKHWLRGAALIGGLVLLVAAPVAYAQTTDGLNRAVAEIGGDGRPLSLSLQILVLMSLLTVLPSLLLMMTSFTRIIIVLSILRQALGLQQTPPNQVLVGLALFLSLFVMRPVIDRDQSRRDQALWRRHRSTSSEAVSRSGVALHGFMIKQTRKTDLTMFAKIAKAPTYATPEGRALLDPAARLRHQRAQDRLPDRLPDLPAVPRHRSRRRFGADVAGHDDAVADDHIDAVQAAAVRPGRRLGADDGLARRLFRGG